MKIKYIATALFICACTPSSGQEFASKMSNESISSATTTFQNEREENTTANKLVSLSELQSTLAGKSHRRHEEKDLYINFTSGYQVGIGFLRDQSGGQTAKGNGIEVQIEMGLSIQSGVMDSKRIGSLTASLEYMYFDAKVSGVQLVTGPEDMDIKFNYACLPITYSNIRGADHKVAFFYQIGLNNQVVVTAYNNDSKAASDFKRIEFSPYISVGIAFPQTAKKTYINFVRCLGFYYSTGLGNISTQSGQTIKSSGFGIRFFSMIIH